MKKLLLLSVALMMGLLWTSCEKEEDGGETKITIFRIDAPFTAIGVVDETNKTISIPVPFGADVSALTGSITVSAGASVTPDLSTPVNFNNPVTFTVTSGSNTSTYTATVQEGENPLRLVMVGNAPTVDELPAEIAKAYNWALDEYGAKASYFAFNELTADAISTATLVWFHYTTFPRPDIEGGAEIFPAAALGSAQSVLTTFYKNGGNFLLTGLSGSYVSKLGRVAPEFGPTNFDIGGDEFITNPDNWGISFKPNVFNDDDYPADNDSHWLFAGLSTSAVTFEGVTYDAIFLSDGGAKKNRGHIWDFNKYYGDSLPGGCDGPNDKKTQFEADTDSKVRASFEWDPAACGVELGAIVEFMPSGDYQGTAVVIGLGAYEWDLVDGRPGQWTSNVEGITANAIDNFVD